MDAPPDAQSVRKLDGRIEITRVALGVAGGLGESSVRSRVTRAVKANFQSLTSAEQVNSVLVGRLAHCLFAQIPLRSHSRELVRLCLLQGAEALFREYLGLRQLEMS